MSFSIDSSTGLTVSPPVAVAQGGTGSTVGAAYGRVVRTAGNITTTSTTLVDVTGATVTITTGANPVAYGVSQSSTSSLNGQTNFFNINIDGTLQLGTSELVDTLLGLAGEIQMSSYSGQSATLSAGSHTIKQVWRVAGSTGTIAATAASSHLFYAQEIR